MSACENRIHLVTRTTTEQLVCKQAKIEKPVDSFYSGTSKKHAMAQILSLFVGSSIAILGERGLWIIKVQMSR